MKILKIQYFRKNEHIKDDLPGGQNAIINIVHKIPRVKATFQNNFNGQMNMYCIY